MVPDEQLDNPKPICPVNFFEVGGIIMSLEIDCNVQ